MFQIIQKRKIFLIISGALVLISVLSLIFWGLKFGADFTGGALMEVEFKNIKRPEINLIREKVNSILGNAVVQASGENNVLLKFSSIDEETRQLILKSLKDKFASKDGNVEEIRFESIGPAIGREMKRKALWAVVLVNFGIMVYVAWAFKKVSKPVSSWIYALSAIAALIHDILITAGLFSVAGHFWGMEFDFMIVVALLTILGYSVNDTIVVYDRIRENLLKAKRSDFENTINESVNQTLARSVNTSLTTELALLALYFFGGETIKHFVLVLIFGIFIGTYSSIYIASALIVEWEKRKI